MEETHCEYSLDDARFEEATKATLASLLDIELAGIVASRRDSDAARRPAADPNPRPVASQGPADGAPDPAPAIDVPTDPGDNSGDDASPMGSPVRVKAPPISPRPPPGLFFAPPSPAPSSGLLLL